MNAPIDFSGIIGTGVQTSQNPYQAEICSYAVIENAARDITTGRLFPFTMGYNLRGNLAFFPKPLNALTNNLFRGSLFTGNTFDRPNHLSSHLQNVAHLPHMIVTPELAKAVDTVKHSVAEDGTVKPTFAGKVAHAVWEGIKSLPELAVKYGPTILEIASLFATDDKMIHVAPINTFSIITDLAQIRMTLLHNALFLPESEALVQWIDGLIFDL